MRYTEKGLAEDQFHVLVDYDMMDDDVNLALEDVYQYCRAKQTAPRIR